MNLPLALIAPEFEQGEKMSCNINGAILLTAHTVPMRVAVQFTPSSVQLIYFQKDLHRKNVLYLPANHRHLPSEQYLEYTMYLVYQKKYSSLYPSSFGNKHPFSALKSPSNGAFHRIY